MRNKHRSKMIERVKAQAAFVEEKLGTGIICKRCDATCATFADACTADLAEMCPGFITIEDARSEFQRLAASGSLSGKQR